MFESLRPMLRIASELRRIAVALEYFAAVDARAHGRMFITAGNRFKGKDESELLHTDDHKTIKGQEERIAMFLQGGSSLLDREEEND